MLTSDLVRIGARGGVAKPSYMKNSDRNIERAQCIIDLVRAHEGATKGELDAALKAETGQGTDWRVQRGLAKLVLDKTEVGVASKLNPRDVRLAVFEAATAHHPVSMAQRAAVLADVATRFKATPEQLDAALYADLAANQQVGPCTMKSGEKLVHRYNVALAQAVLLKSKWMRIELVAPNSKRLRQLLRFLKFHRLMYTVEKLSDGKGVAFKVDGPVSLIKHSSRYGLALANFLPALLLCEEWTLTADYQRKAGTRHALFTLKSTDGLVSHYRDTGTWVAPEETALAKRLAQLAAPWKVSKRGTLLNLDGRDHVVPDITLSDPETGAKAYVEVIWRWRKASLKKRWALLQKAGPKNLVLAVCTSGQDEELPDLLGPVHTFKGVPNARALWKLVKESAAR